MLIYLVSIDLNLNPNKLIKALPNSQIAPGTGTVEMLMLAVESSFERPGSRWFGTGT